MTEGGTAHGFIGASVRLPDAGQHATMRVVVHHGPLEALPAAVGKTWEVTTLTLRTLWKMLTGKASVELGRMFRSRAVEKIYVTVVAGRPEPARGTIRYGLVKAGGRGEGERMRTVHPDEVAATEPVTTGARTAKPFSLPSSSGRTRPTAFAAPVVVGIRLIAAARARRGSL